MISRRRFLRTLTGATAAGLVTVDARPVAAEPPPETTRLRLLKTPSLCWAPQYIADELLRAEGFTEITHLENVSGGPVSIRLAAREADMSLNFVAPNIIRIDRGDPVVFLAGVHVGCFEVFGSEKIGRIRDLRGKTVAVDSSGDFDFTIQLEPGQLGTATAQTTDWWGQNSNLATATL